MQLELVAAELESLLEALDCLKTKIAFAKGRSYDHKTELLKRVELLEEKIRDALVSKDRDG